MVLKVVSEGNFFFLFCLYLIIFTCTLIHICVLVAISLVCI